MARRPQASLDELAVLAGRDWAISTVSQLASCERAIAGGWPGTLSEAGRLLLARMSAAGMRQRPEGDEISRLTRLTYTTAKAEWISRADRETSDPDEVLD